MLLQNKVAIVTGAGRGIGRGIAIALAREKCHVLVADLDAKNAKTVSTEVKKLGVQSLAVKCDVSKKTDVQKMFKLCLKTFKKLDILVNNAGIFPFVSFDKMKESDWDKVMNVNLKSVFYTCSEAGKILPAGGRIITISSIASLVGFAGLTHYCASKGAINSFTRALALEMATKKITVNAVAPGAIDTPGAKGPEEQRKQITMQIPLARYGEPDDIAGAVIYLASDLSSYVTGQTIVVDGGWTLR